MTTSLNALLDRIRGEYLEMPSLRLTVLQAPSLWGLAQEVCEYALARLVGDGFLHRTADGAFVRLPPPPEIERQFFERLA